jgi:aryl-alcohol dehydrogenase-like predicted oxidoreductase
MKKTALGRTGLNISRIGLGAMPLSLAGRPGEEEGRTVVTRAVELGVTFIDTADVYCVDHTDIGHNERLVAGALREMGVPFGGLGAGLAGGMGRGLGAGEPGEEGEEGGAGGRVIVATKGGMVRPEGRWERNGHPEQIRAACEASLRALGVECIDLYQFHAPDPAVPFAESVGAFARLLEEGKVAAVGLSNVSVPQIREAQAIVRVTSVQNRFGPWDVSFRPSPVIEFCREERITFLPYSPLGGSRRAALVAEAPSLQAIAGRLGCTPHELVLAWILRRGSHVVPIPGASRIASIESSVRAASLELDDSLDREIREAFAALPGVEGLMSRVLGRVRRMVGGGG